MPTVRNISSGPRGAYLKGVLAWAEPGEIIEADDFAGEWFVEQEDATDTPPPPKPPIPAGGDPANDVVRDEQDGFALTKVGGGWWQITGPDLADPVKVRGEDAARAKFAEITAR